MTDRVSDEGGKVRPMDAGALRPEAERALAEARARRRAAEAAGGLGREVGGRDGPEPVRFGDWELRGRAIDF